MLAQKIQFRDQRFNILRGRARAESREGNVDVQLVAAAKPARLRAEVAGPLGVHVALLQINESWVYFFLPRQNLLYRFPVSELAKDTRRRERFLKRLPFRFVPELFLDGVLSRVGVEDSKNLSCDYDPEMNAYRLRLPEALPVGRKGRNAVRGRSVGGRMVWVDPSSLAPLHMLYFSENLPPLSAQWGQRGVVRPLIEIDFSDLEGSGVATLPRKIDFLEQGDSVLRFHWVGAEALPDASEELFHWQPTALISIQDF